MPEILLRNQSIFASVVDDELVMLDDKRGLYFGLNPVARKIWELLQSPTTYEALVESLASTYEVEVERCDAEVRSFLDKMREHGLVQLTNASP